jgi:diguanylate cyclase (GGDEF)-like protein/PAS domain S-box-containing protein
MGIGTMPEGLLARIRWVFLLSSLFVALTVVPMLAFVSTETPSLRAAGGIALLVLCWRWVQRYRQEQVSLLWDLAEGPLLLLLTHAVDPLPLVGVFYVSLYYQTLYGSPARVATHILMYLGAFMGAAALDPDVPVLSAAILLHVPGFSLSATMMSIVAITLSKHEQVVAREQDLLARERSQRELADALVMTTDRAGIVSAGLQAYSQVLVGEPVACLAVMAVAGDALTGIRTAAAPAGDAVPLQWSTATLPPAMERARRLREPVVLVDGDAQTVASALQTSGLDLVISLVPFCAHDEAPGLLAVLAASPLPDELIELLTSLGTQVALALERLELSERLHQRQSETRFHALVQSVSDVIALVDAAGSITYLSPSIEQVLGYQVETLIGSDIRALIHPGDVEHVRRLWLEITGDPDARTTLEMRWRHQNGSWRDLEVICTNLLHEPQLAGVVVNARDISERKRAQYQLQHQAFHDPLTELPNRALFMNRLAHALDRSTRHEMEVSVLFLDLDRFKLINDSLGHEAGDRLLVAVAQRIAGCVRAEDTVARFGGDEFAVLVAEPGTAEAAIHVAERITQALDMPFVLQECDVVTGASVGIVVSTPLSTAAAMMRDVDIALYRAKAHGRGRYEVFDETMNAQVLERLQMEADLRLALERGEFAVYYQPKIALETGRLEGMEALLRWVHPTRGIIPPMAFIPLAEETGLIRPIGQWVLEEACRQTKRWHDQLPELTLVTSVNLSARQFSQPALAEDVRRALEQSGVNPSHIQLEITESVAMEDAEMAVTVMERLKVLGVQLAIDDFGTGYSSLAYLKRFPVDALKIDRAFIAGLPRGGESASIVNAMVSLGHALKLEVVAEGIETAEEMHHVRALGCEVGQGYYFARPLTHADADTFLADHLRRAVNVA